MRIVVKEPNKPAVIQYIDGSLKSMQDVIGGYIEPVSVPDLPELQLFVDEEGLLKPNIANAYGLVGTFFVATAKGEHIIGLSERQTELALQVLNNTQAED